MIFRFDGDGVLHLHDVVGIEAQIVQEGTICASTSAAKAGLTSSTLKSMALHRAFIIPKARSTTKRALEW